MSTEAVSKRSRFTLLLSELSEVSMAIYVEFKNAPPLIYGPDHGNNVDGAPWPFIFGFSVWGWGLEHMWNPKYERRKIGRLQHPGVTDRPLR